MSLPIAVFAAGGLLMLPHFGSASFPGSGSSIDPPTQVIPVNIIDGADERDSLLTLGPELGLSSDEIARIRRCRAMSDASCPTPSVGTGALYLTNDQILTAGHIFFEPDGTPRSGCFFKNQDSVSVKIDLLVDSANAAFRREPAARRLQRRLRHRRASSSRSPAPSRFRSIRVCLSRPATDLS